MFYSDSISNFEILNNLKEIDDQQQFTLFQHGAVQEPTQAVVEAPKVFKTVPMEKLKWREPIFGGEEVHGTKQMLCRFAIIV